MLLELCFYLVKLRRAGGHHCHGAGNVARSEANCVFLFPKQGMRAPGATSQSLSELGQAQTHPPLLLIALLSCCGFTVKTVPVSPAKSSHDRQNPVLPPPGRTPKDRALSGTGPAVSPRKLCEFPRRNPQASTLQAIAASPLHRPCLVKPPPCGFTVKVYDLPGKILWLSTTHYRGCHWLRPAICARIPWPSRPRSSNRDHRDWWPISSRSFPRRSTARKRPGNPLEPVQAAHWTSACSLG